MVLGGGRMAFDENNYKKIFESRYGAGSFDSGLSQAREIGRTTVQAKVAKQSLIIMSVNKKRHKKQQRQKQRKKPIPMPFLFGMTRQTQKHYVKKVCIEQKKKFETIHRNRKLSKL
jgi:dsRNA-specific ribonuclease